MPDSAKTAMLLHELAALKPAQRRKVARELRNMSETFAEVSDGQDHLVRSWCARPSAGPGLSEVSAATENGC